LFLVPANFLFFKIVSDFIFVMICIHDTWWLDPFCSFWSMQNYLFFKQVPAKFFVSENSPWRDYFKKQKILQGPKTIFFYRDQNLNGPYMQGRVQYLSLQINRFNHFYLRNYKFSRFNNNIFISVSLTQLVETLHYICKNGFRALTPHFFILQPKFLCTRLLNKNKLFLSNFCCYIYLKIYSFFLSFQRMISIYVRDNWLSKLRK